MSALHAAAAGAASAPAPACSRRLAPLALRRASPAGRDVKQLWKLAGQRYSAPMQQAAAAVGPDYSLWHDLPAEGAAGQLALFRGRAALPTHALGISSFSKAFFLGPPHPGSRCAAPRASPAPLPHRCRRRRLRTAAGAARLPPWSCLSACLTASSLCLPSFAPARRPSDGAGLYGRVLLGKGPLGDLLYPLYFRARVGTAVVPSEWSGGRGRGAAARPRACWRARAGRGLCRR